jgi:hypothetical protein
MVKSRAQRCFISVPHRRFRPTLPPLPSLQAPEWQLESGRAMPAEWVDPNQEGRSSAARTAKLVTGVRRFCPLRWSLRRHKDRSQITTEHVLAADRLRVLADTCAIGLTGGRSRFVMEAALLLKAPRTAPSRSEIKQARAWPAFRRAMAIYNAAERELMTAVVLLNRGVCRLCREARARGEAMHERDTMATLVGCLDRLVEHFRSEVDRDKAMGVAV